MTGTSTTSIDSVICPDAFASWFGMLTPSARREFHQQLSEWDHQPTSLLQKSATFTRFQRAFQSDPEFYPVCRKHLDAIATIEPEIDALAKGTLTDAEKESYGELIFFNPFFQPLNFMPMILYFWSTLRVYILPGLSFLFPLLTLLAPYFLLKLFFRIPITFQNYMHILHSMISGNVQAVLDPTADKSTPSLSPLAIAKQLFIIMITLVQGVLQPYWSYQHLHNVDELIEKKGANVLALRDHYMELSRHLETHGFTFYRCPLPELPNVRVAAAQAMMNGTYFQLALKYIGRLEVILTLAHHADLKPVRWVKSSSPVFRIRNTYDYQVSENVRKEASVTLDAKQGIHALLTGPNKGGKSTVLRSLSVSALLAHTYGCAIGSLTATPFSKMFVCLKPDDLPGSKSRFEREIEFTAETLRHSSSVKPALVFVDELYHSTNPPDALRSCEIYSKQLWKMPNVVSVISTHLFDWVENAPTDIQRLCCPATISPTTDEIDFSYHLCKGVCTVSSVDTLLRKNGLSCARNVMENPSC